MNQFENELRAKIAELEVSLQEAHHKLKSGSAELDAYEGLLKFAMDDMRRIYEDLLKSHSQLMHSDKLAAIGVLAAGIVHELKNPLLAVQGTFLVLKEYVSEIETAIQKKSVSAENVGPLLDQMRVSMEQGIQCVDSLSKIVKDIRVFSRSDKGERGFEDINEVLESVISIGWTSIKHKADLKKFYGGLPKINCNRQQLGQVFLNLLVNAAQAIEKHGTITVKTSQEGTNARIEVSDTGVGMTPEVKSHLFEPFFTTKDSEKGTGLGLSISADIIRKHLGKILVQSEVGLGSTFIILLPIS